MTVAALFVGAYVFSWLAGAMVDWWDWLLEDNTGPLSAILKILSLVPFLALFIFIETVIVIAIVFTAATIISLFSGK